MPITYLNKLSAIARKAALEPQERDNITNTITLFNNCRHRDTSIAWFLACIARMHPKLPHRFKGMRQTNVELRAQIEQQGTTNLTSVIRDSGDDVGRSPDLPTLDCSFKVLGNGRRCNFSHRRNLSFLSLSNIFTLKSLILIFLIIQY